MGRLWQPGPGEILDRLSILALKIHAGRLANKPVDHFQAEQGALDSLKVPNIPILEVVSLAAVNGLLWQAEDSLRRLRESWHNTVEDLQEIQGVAFQIQQLNDRRSELIALINANAGQPHEEKL